MNQELNKIISVMQVKYGNDISIFDTSFLIKSVEKRIGVTRTSTITKYIDYLGTQSNEADLFFHSLFIPFSEFFRNPLTFALLEQVIIPELIQKKIKARHKEIRIWSAACAGGQEAYSIAMILEELLARTDEKLNYRIFATDLHEIHLTEARKGCYTETSLNQVSLRRINKWFTKKGNSFSIQPVLKEHVDFSVFDLLNQQMLSPPASIFGDFDLIFCANLLFYYTIGTREIIVRKINNCLAKGGLLITGETEREILMHHHYQEVFPQSAIFQV
jgi:chemotaxis protein methyltransferase CheR